MERSVMLNEKSVLILMFLVCGTFSLLQAMDSVYQAQEIYIKRVWHCQSMFFEL